MIFKTEPADFKKEIDIVACYIEHGDTFVVLHRNNDKTNGGKWGLPAGKMDKGETMHQAMRREIKEETGLDIPEEDLNYFDSIFVRNVGHDIGYHMFSTKIAEKPEIILEPNEHQASRWVTPREYVAMDFLHDMDEIVGLFYKM